MLNRLVCRTCIDHGDFLFLVFQTWFFVHLLDGESQFQQSSQTLKHVDGITDIVTGCYRVKVCSSYCNFTSNLKHPLFL